MTAVDTANNDGTVEFGRVSRVKGILFEFLTLGASLAGIVALLALLAYVFWDAFGLGSAGVAWYGTFGVTVLAPVVGFLLYANWHPAAGAAGLELLTAVTGGVMVGIGLIIVLLIVTGGPVLFAYFLTMIAPAVGLWAYGKYDRSANWANLGVLAVLLVGPVVGTLFLDPISDIGRLLGEPGIVFISVVLPGAGVLYYVLAQTYEYSARVALNAALALPAVAISGGPLVDGSDRVSRSVWLILLVTLALTIGVAIANTIRERERWAGFGLPASLIAGVLLLRAVADQFGFARPTPWLDWQFLNAAPSFSTAADAGIYPAIIGSVFLISLVAVLTFAVGVGAAIYLEEYASPSGRSGTVVNIIRVNISNLAGVPSVVYGLLGLGIFVNLEATLEAAGLSYTYAGIGAGTVLTAAFTLSLLILPIVIIAAQEALRSVPDSLQQASYGMGATQWQTIRNVVLPRAMPGIMTGTILALGRAIGETAPLIMIGAATAKFSPPTDLFSKLTAMPLQIYTTAFLPGDDFQRGVTAAGVVALLIVLLTMNSVAILLRNKFESKA